MSTSLEMTTLSQVLEKLRLKKYDNEFMYTPGGFTTGNNKFYQPEDLVILKTYRFEGESSPSDSSILYLIQANDGLTGYSIDAFGAYSGHEEGYYELLKKIPIEDRDEQLLFE